MLGNESADDALARFSAALDGETERLGAGLNLVVITHGTVMALFAGAHSPVDPWRMWQRLQCGDAIEFALPGFCMSGASSPDEVTALYERHAGGWDAQRPRTLFERAWLDRFLDLLPERGSVLDLGCGAGEPIDRYLIDKGHPVLGVDTSPSLIARCRARFPEQTWRVADMRSLALDATFDGIIAWDSFFHLTREDQRAMFGVFAHHAGPDAALLFTSGSRDGEVTGALLGEPLYHASLAADEYRELLAEHGFAVVSHVEEDPDCADHTVWLTAR
jgi:SAM-dependent methyltransferase